VGAPPSRRPVSERVFRALCDAVLSGRYGPGEKLPTQRRLAADLGVNMGPVREALKRLEQLRLVESRQGDAMRVTDWRARGGLDVIAHVLVRSGALDREALDGVMEARASMLSEAARLAAARRTDEEATRLVEIAAALAVADDPDAAQALDFAFFAELVEASGNLVFVLVMNSIRELYFEHAELFRAIVGSEGGGAAAAAYERAARAVEHGSSDEAAAVVRELAEGQAERLGAALAAAAPSASLRMP
jgi:GntR family transcriptional regulator, transcriptional repressor for pyruvate dehydrogenase complex